MKNIRYLSVQFDQCIQPDEIRFFRSAVIEKTADWVASAQQGQTLSNYDSIHEPSASRWVPAQLAVNGLTANIWGCNINFCNVQLICTLNIYLTN